VQGPPLGNAAGPPSDDGGFNYPGRDSDGGDDDVGRQVGSCSGQQLLRARTGRRTALRAGGMPAWT
jgi:hypothetical protein